MPKAKAKITKKPPFPQDVAVCIQKIREAAEKIYKVLGPGHSESAYQKALAYELRRANINYEKEVGVEFLYDGICVGEGAVDFVVYSSTQKKIVVDLKVIGGCGEASKQQVRCYMEALGTKFGLVLHFWKPGEGEWGVESSHLEPFRLTTQTIEIHGLLQDSPPPDITTVSL